MTYAHRIAVLQGGRITRIFTREQFDRFSIGRAMTGEQPTASTAPAPKRAEDIK